MEINKPILVTQPTLPSLKEFTLYLEKIWENKWLTNNGQFHQEFEQKIAEYLGVSFISLFSNGTLALMTAYQALELTGEVITTPYSFVATTHAMIWNKLTPVFCDVDPVYGNIDPDKIEILINEKTTAIVPVHVYGNPAEIEKIEAIAKKHNLKVIYDAAHAFGVTQKGESILNFGDMSILSFHATKTFNTIEGGALVCNDAKMKQQIDYLKNFGFEDEITVVAPGINAKMNEVQSAFGILQLKTIDRDIERRRAVAKYYRDRLKKVKGIRVLEDMEDVKHNYSYFPIFINNDYPMSRDELFRKLKDHNIFGRRYFYPLISEFSMYNKLESAHPNRLPIAFNTASEVICLPIYPELSEQEMDYIISKIV